MRKLLIIAIQILILSSALPAQETLGNFVSRAEGFYHYLATPSVQNFSCKLTSHFYINFMTQEGIEDHNYPLKFVWTNEGKRYYVLEPLPELSDSSRKEALQNAQIMKNLFESIILDLQKMIFRSPLVDIPLAASMTASTDSIGITYAFESSNSNTVTTREMYTPSGRFNKFVWQFGTQKVINYPKFETVKGRWICNGWDSQVYNDAGEIISGIAARVMYNSEYEEKGRYLPEKIEIIAQTKEDPTKDPVTNRVILFIKDFVFNEDIQVLTEEDAQSTTSAAQ